MIADKVSKEIYDFSVNRWRRDMADMINELDFDVPPGSELWLFNNVPMQERATKLLDKGNKSPLKLKNLQALPNPDDNRSAVFDCSSEARSTSCFIIAISNGFQY